MQSERHQGGSVPVAGATVVLVTPEGAQRDRLRRALRERGHTVIAFDSAADAIAAIAPPLHTVLVVSHEPADMKGVEFIHALRARGLHLPTIMVVQPNAVSDAVQAIRGGAVDVLEQPLDEGHLVRTIEQALGESPVSIAKP